MKERIRVVELKKRIVGKHHGKSDDWLLVTGSLDNSFRTISEILYFEDPFGKTRYDRKRASVVLPILGQGKASF